MNVILTIVLAVQMLLARYTRGVSDPDSLEE